MTTVAPLIGVLVFAPLVIFPAVLILALLFGAIQPGGIWRDSFDPAQASAARIAQFLFALAAAAAAFIGLAQTGGTAFVDVPGWLATVVGGSNLFYLAANWTASRRADGGPA
jgi:hypothetical protein